MILFRPDGCVLMEERDNNTINYPGFWNLPSGGCEEGEAPEITAKRELIEEANYRAPSLKFLFTSPQHRPDGQETVRHVFLVGYDPSQRIQKGGEGKDLRFIDPAEFSNMKVFQDHVEFVERARELLQAR